jgi:myosin heavy subunit
MLQHHFNFVIFTAEKALYLQEGVSCDTIEFQNNCETIREIEGLFRSLDEEARIPKVGV